MSLARPPDPTPTANNRAAAATGHRANAALSHPGPPPARARRWQLAGCAALLALAACGGGGGSGGDGAAASAGAAAPATSGTGSLSAALDSPSVASATAPATPATDGLQAVGDGAAVSGSAPSTADPAVDATSTPEAGGHANSVPQTDPQPMASGSTAASADGGGASGSGSATTTATNTTLQAPVLPRTGLTAQDLAVIIAAGDPLSEAIGRAYQLARGIPDAQVLRIAFPTDSDRIDADAFTALKAQIDAQLPERVQATVLAFGQPSRVHGSCDMSITSAMAFGYDAAQCGGCSATTASPYYDSDTTHPWTDLRLRPSMMLPAASLDEAQTWIQRGVSADGTAPTGTGWLVRTNNQPRSVRYTDWATLPDAWAGAVGLDLRYVDASVGGSSNLVTGQSGLMFYFTGLALVDGIATNQWRPGAVADHLTSFGGYLPGGSGQMPATAWLTAGATASYGTVEEPCNYTTKFPKVSVLLDHYLRGATVIEAYWKSVAWPGQGLFIGEPLARPWSDPGSSEIVDGAWVMRTHSLRRNGVYRLDYRSSSAGAWQELARHTAGQPQPITWRTPLPATTGELRWMGPCPTAPGSTCELARSGG